MAQTNTFGIFLQLGREYGTGCLMRRANLHSRPEKTTHLRTNATATTNSIAVITIIPIRQGSQDGSVAMLSRSACGARNEVGPKRGELDVIRCNVRKLGAKDPKTAPIVKVLVGGSL